MFLKTKSKDKKFDILHYRNCLFLVCTMNDIFPGGVTKMEVPEGRGVHFVSRFWKIQTGGWHRKNSFRGGLWIFSG